MLQGTLTIHDLKDVEAFCSAALDQTLKRWRSTLEPSDRDDALAYLISETWRISTRYNPKLSPSFAAYARNYQPRFLIEFYRRRWLDTRNSTRYSDEQWGQIQQLIYTAERLDAPLRGHTDDGDPRTLGELLTLPDSSTSSDSDTAIERANRERDRNRARDISAIHQRVTTNVAA